MIRNDVCRDASLCPQVPNDLIPGLNVVFGEVAAAFGVKGDVLLNTEVVRAVGDDASVVGLKARFPQLQ